MAKIPEYERRQGVTPSQELSAHPESVALSSIPKTMPQKGLGKQFEQLGSQIGEYERFLGGIGTTIAKNAAIENATLEGIKAGQKPGRTLIPAFTETDKAFVHAYKQEELSTVTRQAESFLNKIYNQVSKNPSQENLQAFEQAVAKEFNGLAEMVSEDNRPRFAKALASAFESKYYQLSNAVQAKNDQNLKLNFKFNFTNAVNQLQDYQANGQRDKAKIALERNVEYINSIIGTAAIPTKEVAAEYIKTLKEADKAAIAQDDFREDLINGKASEVLAERSKLPQTAENQAITEALYKQYQNYNHLLSSKSHANKVQGLMEAEQGELSAPRMAQLKEDMTEHDRVDFDAQLSKINLKNVENANAIQSVKENRNNAFALATVKPEILNKLYEQDIKDFQDLNGRVPNLAELAGIVSQYQAPIPDFNKQLSVLINSNDVTKATGGASIYSGLIAKNPRALDMVSEATGAKAQMINSAIHAGETPMDAFNFANETIAGMTEEGIKERTKAFKDLKTASKLNEFKNQLKEASKTLGFDKTSIPAGFVNDYMDNLERGYILTKNLESAREYAKRNIERVYGETEVNGFKQVMWMPPSKAFPSTVSSDKYVQKALKQKSASWLGDEYEFESEKEDSIKLKSKYTDKKGSLYIQPDDVTALPAEGQTPSYGVYFLPDGAMLPKPISDPKDPFSIARFSLTNEDIEKAMDDQNLRQEMLYNTILKNQAVDREIQRVIGQQQSRFE